MAHHPVSDRRIVAGQELCFCRRKVLRNPLQLGNNAGGCCARNGIAAQKAGANPQTNAFGFFFQAIEHRQLVGIEQALRT